MVGEQRFIYIYIYSAAVSIGSCHPSTLSKVFWAIRKASYFVVAPDLVVLVFNWNFSCCTRGVTLHSNVVFYEHLFLTVRFVF